MTKELTQVNRKLTFEEYRSLDAEDWAKLGLPEGRYEYTDGELVEVPSESESNDFIANFLFFVLASSGLIPLRLIRPHSCEIEVLGKPRTRYPDLVILREEHLNLTQRRLLITLEMPSPQLVVEIVSPGDSNRKRDYESKREQYQHRGIPEYWLIDPELQAVIVLELKEGKYTEVGVFQGNERIISPLFPELHLTVGQVFELGE